MTIEWDPVQWDEEEPKPQSGLEKLQDMSIPRQMLSGAIGPFQAAGSMLSTIPAMAVGGAHGLGTLATGGGMEQAAANAQKTTNALTYEPGTAAGQMFVEGAGHAFDWAKERAGDVAVEMLKEHGRSQGIDTLDPKMEAALRTGGEAALEGVAAISPLKGLKARAPEFMQRPLYTSAADKAAAQELLQRKMAGDAEYSSWEQAAKESADYAAALRELDNSMIQYKGKLQAPQLGGGGKVARPEDTVGQRVKGPFASQIEWDEEMHKTGEDYQEQRNIAHEQALAKGEDQLGQYGPTYEGSTLDHAPSPVRPGQVAMERNGPISEGEATKIYMKPRFERTTEERLQLQEYEAGLRGPDIKGVINPRKSRAKPQEDMPPETNAWEEGFRAYGLNLEDFPSKIRNYADAAANRTAHKRAAEESLFDEYGRAVDETAARRYQEIYREELMNEANYAKAMLYSTDRGWRELGPNEQLPSRVGNSDILGGKGFDSSIPPSSFWNKYKNGDQEGYPFFTTYNPKLIAMQHDLGDAFTGRKRPTFRKMIQMIADEGSHPMLREVAKLLLSDPKWNPRFELTNATDTAGKFRGSRYKIEIRPSNAGDEVIMLHEAIHSRSTGAIEMALRHPDKYGPLQIPVQRLQDLFTSFKDEFAKEFPDKKEPYGLLNIHEFMAESFSNPHFQDLLARKNIPAHLAGSRWASAFRNYWDAFVDSIGKLLGFNRSTRTYLSEVMKAGSKLIKEDSIESRTYFPDLLAKGLLKGESVPGFTDADHIANWLGDHAAYDYKDFQRDLKAQGLKLTSAQMKAMYDKAQPEKQPVPAHPDAPAVETIKQVPGLEKIQQQYADRRTWQEVLPTIQKAKDVTIGLANATAKMIQGKFTASDHPLWSWTSSQIHWLKNDALTEANKKLHGTDRKNPEPGTYNHMWRLLTAAEREELRKVGWEFNNKEGLATTDQIQAWARKELGHELNPHQIRSYQDRVRTNKEVLGDINKLLVAEGKEPIPELPNYWSPNVFSGPYLLKFIDKETGQTTKIESSYLRPNEKNIASEFPKYKLEVVETGLKGKLDFEQLEWVLRQLHKEQRDPAAKAIAEGLRRQGFMKHGLKRRGVEGGEGSTGKNALRDYEETSEEYIRDAYQYIANRKLDKLYNQILDEKSIDSQKHAKGYALEAIDTARGGANEAMEKFSATMANIVRGGVQIGTGGLLKLPQRFTKDLLRYSNKVGTTMLLGFGNLTNIAAQLLQAHTYTLPKLEAMAVEHDAGQVAVLKALASAHKELVRWDDSKDVQKLKEIGAMDPTFKYDWSTYASDSDPRWKSTMADHLTGISLLSWIEGNVVRRSSGLMFLHMLRELGYDKIAKTPDEIYYVAKELTDQYMVSTKWYEKPHMFSRSGLVGTALSPLQSFSTTWAGMFREYSKLAASGLLDGSPAKTMPLASFMAVNLLTAGFLGLVGVKEWDAIAMWLNDHFGYNVPTGTETIMSRVKTPFWRYGGLSDAVGMSVGATFNAPTLTGSFGIGGQMIWNAIKALYQTGKYAGSEMGLNQPPQSYEMRDALKGVTPRFSPIPGANWADIEKSQTPPGMPYQDTKGNAGPITRDDHDWLARRLGTYSIRESEEKNTNYIAKRMGDQRSRRLSEAMSKAVDGILMDPQHAMERLEPIFKDLEKDKFSGDDIKNGLKRELLNKIIESDQRMVGKGQSTKQQQLYLLLQQLR